jgi:hypothetical protein
MPVSSWFHKASVAKLIAWLAVERFTEQLCNCALRFKGGISDAGLRLQWFESSPAHGFREAKRSDPRAG